MIVTILSPLMSWRRALLFAPIQTWQGLLHGPTLPLKMEKHTVRRRGEQYIPVKADALWMLHRKFAAILALFLNIFEVPQTCYCRWTSGSSFQDTRHSMLANTCCLPSIVNGGSKPAFLPSCRACSLQAACSSAVPSSTLMANVSTCYSIPFVFCKKHWSLCWYYESDNHSPLCMS